MDPRDDRDASTWPPLLSTAAATRYCGYKSTSALRKAHHEGRIAPVGRRGGNGTCMWSRADLDRFLRGEAAADVAAEGDAAASVDKRRPRSSKQPRRRPTHDAPSDGPKVVDEREDPSHPARARLGQASTHALEKLRAPIARCRRGASEGAGKEVDAVDRPRKREPG